METRANYVLIGAFTVLTTVLLLLFALWASKFSSSRNWHQYEVVFSEPVTGLTEGGSVQYNGLAVGTVEDLSLDEHDARKVIAVLKLKSNTPIKTDTRAKLSQQGITGVPFIQLTGGSPTAQRLTEYKAGVTSEKDPALFHIMAQVTAKLTEQEIGALSSYIQGLHDRADDVAAAGAALKQ